MKKQKQVYVSESAAQTKRLGLRLAKEILIAGPDKSARLLAMSGELGAGKTNFAQGFAKGLGVKETINSPTFGIMKKYALPAKSGFDFFYHIDCYRLESVDEVLALDIEKIFADPRNIIAIEWPEIAAKILPENAIKIEFEVIGKKSRCVVFNVRE